MLLVGDAPGKTIPNHAIADLVLGQPDFVTLAIPPPSPFTLGECTGVVIDLVSRKLFVTDTSSNRVLRYPSVNGLLNGAGAEAVFGQARFSTTTANTPTVELGINSPYGIFFDRKGRLWVADGANNRVLMFEAVSSKSTGSDANGVLGQVNFTDSIAGSGASGLQSPRAVAVSASGALYVACLGAHRVMRFDNAASLVPGINNADAVLGQENFTTTSPGTSKTRMASPVGLTITPDDSLWVSELGNHRLLRFDSASVAPIGSPADGVVGQPDFITATPGNGNRGLNIPAVTPTVDATGSLWVPDAYNARVLRFPPDVTKPLLAVSSEMPKTTTKRKLLIKGTASDLYGVSKVQYKVGKGTLKTAGGTPSNWQFTANLAKGKNTITIFATDSVGNVSLNRVLKVKRK